MNIACSRRKFFRTSALGFLGWIGVKLSLGNAAPARLTAVDLPGEMDPERLALWKRAPRLPVLESDDPVTSRLLLAMREGRAVEIVYYGLNETGVRRRICPGTIFTVEGFLGTYVSGFCFLRKQERTFCCERMLLA